MIMLFVGLVAFFVPWIPAYRWSGAGGIRDYEHVREGWLVVDRVDFGFGIRPNECYYQLVVSLFYVATGYGWGTFGALVLVPSGCR